MAWSIRADEEVVGGWSVGFGLVTLHMKGTLGRVELASPKDTLLRISKVPGVKTLENIEN